MSRCCCIVGCESRECDPDYKVRAFFNVSAAREQRWLKIITPYIRKGKPSRKRLHVCDAHFNPNDLIIVPSIGDGCRNTIKLKCNSIPNAILCQPPTIKGEIVKTEPMPITEVSTDALNTDEPFDLPTLRTKLSDGEICLPQYWSVCDTIDGLVFCYVGDEYTHATRSIFCKADMTVEVRAYNVVCTNIPFEKIIKVGDIVATMENVQNLRLCEGVDGKESCGFVEPGSYSLRCNQCRKIRKREQCRVIVSNKRKIHRKESRQLQRLTRKILKLQNEHKSAAQLNIQKFLPQCDAIDSLDSLTEQSGSETD